MWVVEKAERKADASRGGDPLYLPLRRGVMRLLFVPEGLKLPGDTGITTVTGDTHKTVTWRHHLTVKGANMNMIPMNLQFFAEPGGDPAGTEPAAGAGAAAQTGQQSVDFDYEKLAEIVAGKQSTTVDSVLKGYFKQHGLSKEEMSQAITAFKEQQKAQQPDVEGLQTQAAEATQIAQKARVESKATLTAVEIGIDAKSIPYVLKLADFSQAVGAEGEIKEDAVKSALEKVLEDVPALKPNPAGQTGFVQVGTGGGNKETTNNDDALKAAFGL